MVVKKILNVLNYFMIRNEKKIMSAQGFEPWKQHVLELEPSSFDHSEILTKKYFPHRESNPGQFGESELS